MPDVWFYFLFPKLVAVNIAVPVGRQRRVLHFHDECRVYPAADGGYMDVAPAEKLDDGRHVQHGEQKFHAGNQADGKRLLR